MIVDCDKGELKMRPIESIVKTQKHVGKKTFEL